MIDLEIGGGVYQAPQSWDEITLKQFIDICSIAIPEKLLELYIASAKMNDAKKKEKKAAELEYDKISEKITTKELLEIFPKYYGLAIMALTDIPEDVMDKIDGESRTNFFNQYLRYVVLSTFYWQPVILTHKGIDLYSPATIKSFKIDEMEYMLPESLKIYGEDIPMASEKIVSFAEASKIEMELHNLNNEGVSQLPMLIAIYCRPEIAHEKVDVIEKRRVLKLSGWKIKTPFRYKESVKSIDIQIEEYDEHKVIRRAPLMEGLMMDKVWAVFFCISGLFTLYQNSIRAFTQGLDRLHREHSTGKVASTIMAGGEKSTK